MIFSGGSCGFRNLRFHTRVPMIARPTTHSPPTMAPTIAPMLTDELVVLLVAVADGMTIVVLGTLRASGANMAP